MIIYGTETTSQLASSKSELRASLKICLKYPYMRTNMQALQWMTDGYTPKEPNPSRLMVYAKMRDIFEHSIGASTHTRQNKICHYTCLFRRSTWGIHKSRTIIIIRHWMINMNSAVKIYTFGITQAHGKYRTLKSLVSILSYACQHFILYIFKNYHQTSDLQALKRKKPTHDQD